MNEQPTSEATGQHLADPVTLSRTVSRPLDSIWKALMTPAGAQALLGEGGVLGDKGDSWTAADGTRGVVRSFHPREQIRFSWHADDDAPATLVELDLAGDGEQTRLDLRHDHLPPNTDRDALAQRWGGVLDRLATVQV